MSLNPSKSLEFSHELITWFWKFGVVRTGIYKLQTSGWLHDVYEASERIELAESSAKNLRPAFALWGPSQAGKSTLLSNFLDEKVWGNLPPEGPVDASQSGLSWPGADPCVFFVDLPGNQMHRAEGLNSMNPFTGGRDASAVLTRFVHGSLTRGEGSYHIPIPKYPVQVHFLGEKQVMHALAMGYDTDCLGNPELRWQQTEWSKSPLINALDQFSIANPVPENAPVNREAFEIIHCLCEVLVDLVNAKVRRFVKLGHAATTAEWQSEIFSFLEQPSLLASPENARRFAGVVLWDGADLISEFHGKILKMLKNIEGWRGEKKVYTSLTVATKLLDMDTYDKAESGSRPLPRIGWLSEGDAVVLDLNAGQPVVESLEDFGALQGLVWEIVVPVNFDNLSESKFKDFLGKGDLLDFPGVANEQANDVKKIAVWSKIEEKEAKIPEKDRIILSKEQRFTPYLFFSKILKRGKTASIVTTYAKRMTVDAFTIFLYLDKHPPVNADQILNGIKTWWDCMDSGYDHNLGGRSPLPLNLALTWWAQLFGEYKSLLLNGGEYFAARTPILRAMGRVSKPEVLWSTCALNYYKYDRGQSKDDSITPDVLFTALLKEKDLLLQFASRPVREGLETSLKEWEARGDRNIRQKMEAWCKQQGGRLSTDAGLQTLKIMLEDRQKGGADYLLTLFCEQLDELKRGTQLNRGKILEESRLRETERLDGLLKGESMFPPPVTRNVRLEHLQTLKDKLIEATQVRTVNQGTSYFTEERIRPVNLALRELLNVNYTDLGFLPRQNHSINGAYIHQQYQGWVRKQALRWRSPEQAEANQEASWSLLGLTSPGLVEGYLNSLVDSILAVQLEEIARWLRQDVLAGRDRVVNDVERSDQRPLLAVRMTNELLGGSAVDYDGESKPASYAAVIEPFLSQLDLFLKAKVQKLVQEAVPGNKELTDLCKQYDVAIPAKAIF